MYKIVLLHVDLSLTSVNLLLFSSSCSSTYDVSVSDNSPKLVAKHNILLFAVKKKLIREFPDVDDVVIEVSLRSVSLLCSHIT